MTQKQFVQYKTVLYDGIARALVHKAKEKPKSVEEWMVFIEGFVTRVKDGNRVKYYLNYESTYKSVILLAKAKEELGMFEEYMQSKIKTIEPQQGLVKNKAGESINVVHSFVQEEK